MYREPWVLGSTEEWGLSHSGLLRHTGSLSIPKQVLHWPEGTVVRQVMVKGVWSEFSSHGEHPRDAPLELS